MNKRYKLLYLLAALLLFIMAWISYQRIRTVTYTYTFESPSKDTDFRFFQYVTGNQIKVISEDTDRDLNVTTERFENGTVVMVEGYGSGESGQVWNFTLSYKLNPIGFVKQDAVPEGLYQSLEKYRSWVEEYHVPAKMPLNSDRAASGNKAFITMVKADMDMKLSFQLIVYILAGVIYGLLCIGLAFRSWKIPVTQSGQFAVDFLKSFKEAEDESALEEQNYGNRMFAQYVHKMETIFLILCGLLILASILTLPCLDRSISMIWIICLAIAVITGSSIYFIKKTYDELRDILLDQCRPLASTAALTSPYGKKLPFKMRLRRNYLYQSDISLSLFYQGEFELTLQHLQVVKQECEKALKNQLYYLHYHITRMNCYLLMEDMEKASEEESIIEALIRKQPRWEKNPVIKRYRENQRCRSYIRDEEFSRAIEVVEAGLRSDSKRYQQVSRHYDLWKIAMLTSNQEQMKEHEEFISTYGRMTFYYAWIKRQEDIYLSID